jgi:beta-phosphoglucomutase
MEKFFDAIADGNDIKKSKPDPEVFLKASELLLVEPLRCLVIEDSVAGVEAARAGKMDSVAIGDAVKSNLATYNIHTFSQLLKLI